MLKFTVSVAVLGLFLFLAGPVFADGYGPHHGGYQNHQSYYHGGHGYHGGNGYRGGYYQVYAPPVCRPRVVYPAPWVVPAPVYNGYYAVPGPSVYLQGRNFSFGVGF